MEEILDKVNNLIEESNNIPSDIKDIVKAICRGYIRENNGKIPLEGIVNVCNTTFKKIEENDMSFSGKKKIMGTTETNYDDKCNIIHEMCYVNFSDYKKMIAILTHELGHVITESRPCHIDEKGIYPYAKRTATYYKNCGYNEKNQFCAYECYGSQISDGFLESISTKIYSSKEFREELLKSGYDLEDYIYKDERLFPSRIYDEYKACFELFDYIMDGKLFDFSCMTFSSNDELENYIDNNKITFIFNLLDKSNNALWDLKDYEGKEYNKEFEVKFKEYYDAKEISMQLVEASLDFFGKTADDKKYQELYDAYDTVITKQKLLPIPKKYLKTKSKKV